MHKATLILVHNKSQGTLFAKKRNIKSDIPIRIRLN